MMFENLVNQTILPADQKSSAKPFVGQRRIYAIGKRLIDLTLVLLGGPVVLALIGVLAVLVSLDGGPVFYLQPRIGRNGRVFRIWKLRSMVPDADTALQAFLAANPDQKAEWDKHQKLRHDPRLTAIGGVLRRYSLDELPQLWNVLTGDMSLVGPRPMMPNQRVLYEGTAYYDLRPGLTGSWQISERNNSSFANRVRYDEQYGTGVSAMTDFKILFGTIGVVFRGTGY